ncbi:NAD(P)/FAD-dependent oxidoreductase, partial [Escherichia coli]|nr:NAD(P)/FAD-dependent oxidoreductase [Escherichia coli]
MRKQILMVGAGFAGMWAALSAARLADTHQQAIDITVIAPQPEMR